MKVSLKNVGVIDSCDVEFTPGISLIVGSSGSGKSTLLRSIYNMASNEFSDSDISFGHNTMNISIECNGNKIEYIRSIKAKSDRFYYIVNGETYTKVGRTALPAVTDSLKIGSINVNGEDINFNFNLQFSSPFLVLGNQSTLYNVLTYRSSFDISSINDYYSADIKSNANELSSNNKLKERLEDSLKCLEDQAKRLSPIEQLYSDFIQYKHELEILENIRSLSNVLTCYKVIYSNVDYINDSIIHNEASSYLVSTIIEFEKYNILKHQFSEICSQIKENEDITNKYNYIIELLSRLIDLNNELSILKHKDRICDKVYEINKVLGSTEVAIKDEQLACDIIACYMTMKKHNKCTSIINTLRNDNSKCIQLVEELLSVKDKLSVLNSINVKTNSINDDINKNDVEIHKFKCCPLCGNSVEMCGD